MLLTSVMNMLFYVPTVCENNQKSTTSNLGDMEIRILYPTLSPNKMVVGSIVSGVLCIASITYLMSNQSCFCAFSPYYTKCLISMRCLNVSSISQKLRLHTG